MKRNAFLLALVSLVGLIGTATFATVVFGSPSSGVTPTLLARGTYPAFDVKTDPQSAVDFKAKAKDATDMVVQRHDFAPGATSGWHQHPGPILITVIQGQLTFYERDDPTCSPHVVSTGQGYVDTGHGHIAFNTTSATASDVAVAIAPVGAAFRTELPAPGPYCNF